MKLFREILFPLVAVLAAFLIGGIFVLAIGDSPIETYRLLIGSALSWPDGIGYTLFYATPLIFTGLAVMVAFRCGLLNIGAEGQLYVAAFATAWVGITFAHLSAWILLPLVCLAAILAGGVWGAIPGVLKARFGSHEVINTIMLNFIAVALVQLLHAVSLQNSRRSDYANYRDWTGRAYSQTREIHSRTAGAHPAESGLHFCVDCVCTGLHISLENKMGL